MSNPAAPATPATNANATAAPATTATAARPASEMPGGRAGETASRCRPIEVTPEQARVLVHLPATTGKAFERDDVLGITDDEHVAELVIANLLDSGVIVASATAYGAYHLTVAGAATRRRLIHRLKRSEP